MRGYCLTFCQNQREFFHTIDSSWFVCRFYLVDLKSHIFEMQEIILWTDMEVYKVFCRKDFLELLSWLHEEREMILYMSCLPINF